MIAAKNRWSTPIATKMDVAESKKQPFSAPINLLALSNVIIGSGDGKKYRERYAVAPNSVISAQKQFSSTVTVIATKCHKEDHCQ